ncbi:MAG: hypothetical protein HZA94_00830 [Candidatus Vogelbacteria bacterium]|nr:hypothetical protein [Candidatus Vogelbacteria bacterium]
MKNNTKGAYGVKTISGWADEFMKQVKRLKQKSGGNWYKHPQPSLKELKRTGQGNCVAWTKLAKEIALKMGLEFFIVSIRYKGDHKTWWSLHQIGYVFDRDGSVWSLSNIWIKRTRKFRKAAKVSMTDMIETIRRSLRNSRWKWRWKTIPFIEDLWYCRDNKIERIIRNGIQIRKIKS